MVCGSAFKNKGVQLLLDAVTDYLPSPLDRGNVQGVDVNDAEVAMSRALNPKPSKNPYPKS